MPLDNKLKLLNQDGDYYFCNFCNAWHHYRTDATSQGYEHMAYFDEDKTNSSLKYFFCGFCNKWHTGARNDHLQYRLHIQRDPNLKLVSPVKLPRAPSNTQAHHSSTDIIGSFDGTAGLWKNEDEILSSITSLGVRFQCKAILSLVKNLDKNLHIQLFNRKKGFSFIVKGLKISEVEINSDGFVLTLIKNILNQGYTSVHQEKKDFKYADSYNLPVSEDELRNHFISGAKKLIELRRNNIISYQEKWLHSLLIEKMQDDGLSGLELEFLFYETPVGKVKRGKKYAREHIDILAKERFSKALVVVEVKKSFRNLAYAVSQGLSYVEWLVTYKEQLKPRIAQLGWDVEIDNLKLMIIAPDVDFKDASIDANILEHARRLNCHIKIIHLNSDWAKKENINVKDIYTIL